MTGFVLSSLVFAGSVSANVWPDSPATEPDGGKIGALITPDNTNSRVGINNATPATALDVTGTVTATEFVGGGAGLTGIVEGDLSYGSSASSPDDAVYVDDDGDVGIGTASPTTNLEIKDAVATSGLGNGTALYIRNTDGAAIDRRAELRFAAGTSSDLPYGIISVSRSSTDAAGDMIFATLKDGEGAAVERMRIDNVGNVGIGTTSPGSELVVADSSAVAELRIDSAASNEVKLSFQEAGTTKGLIDYRADQTTERFDFFVGGSAAGNRVMVLEDGGNVGIGTVSPTTLLELNDGTTQGGYLAETMLGINPDDSSDSAISFLADSLTS